jgi:hypothetical protein
MELVFNDLYSLTVAEIPVRGVDLRKFPASVTGEERQNALVEGTEVRYPGLDFRGHDRSPKTQVPLWQPRLRSYPSSPSDTADS